MAVPIIGSVLKKTFGTRNDRMVKHYLSRVASINALESDFLNLTDQELKAKTLEFRERVRNGEKAYDMIPEIFAVAREAMDRSVGIRNVFNPAENFDRDRLPESVRPLFDQTKAQIEGIEDAAPEGELAGCSEPTPAWQLVDIPVEIYHAVRELYPDSKPPFRARPFDVQLIGGIVLSQGKIAEMKTGEGKTIVAPLASYLACIEEKQVHVITVNDYLVQRDRDWVFPFFRAMGLTVGAIHPQHMQTPDEKKLAYTCDAIYGTTSEFGFDYLRDNMKLNADMQFQKKHEYAIVDEVDSTLIDEARTPLIISGLAHQTRPRYELADELARHLVNKQVAWSNAEDKVNSCEVAIAGLEGDIRNASDKSIVPALKDKITAKREELPRLESDRDRYIQYYEIEMDKKKAAITDEGIAEAQRKSNIGSFYVGENIDMPHLLEQSVRAHTVYKRDRDYVVAQDQNGEAGIVIVDQNTGRKMVGRQWSDGLHQAVECREGVPIKDETQTMATITIQNYYKMYERLSGMTGTADTEATEFHEIYSLDVISIPTNVPIQRGDRNDWVFSTEKGKWDAIVQEIAQYHDAGRPVLVGTTSVDKSEMLSRMLSNETKIPHEVLNAKQHEREADIVKSAGQLGAVMIATNMAGRGTDIKLGRITREQLVDHWKRLDLCPREAKPEWADDEILTAVYRHLCIRRAGFKKDDAHQLDLGEARRAFMLHCADELAEKGLGLRISKQPASGDALAAWEKDLCDGLDSSGMAGLHKLEMWTSIEELGGLHIVGTERHESRRIDNQLRGRAGRQGDNGSSRFFLSLEDDLMKMFAGKIVNTILSRSGFKEGVVLEAGMLTKSVARAQRKVEERNFQWRKNILEYDEPMEYQRHSFYGMRQPILEGKGIKETIFEQLENAVWEGTTTYLGPDHRNNCLAEWISENFGVDIPKDRFRKKDREDIHRLLKTETREDAFALIRITATEFMPDDGDVEDIEWSGLAEWCNDVYGSSVTGDEIEGFSRKQVCERFDQAAETKFSTISLEPLDKFLIPDFQKRELCEWTNRKFLTKLKTEDLMEHDSVEAVSAILMKAIQIVYTVRERDYPISQALERTNVQMQTDPKAAVTNFTSWVNSRYDLNWSPNALPSGDPVELRKILLEQSEKWTPGRFEERAKMICEKHRSTESVKEWLGINARIKLTDDEIQSIDDGSKTILEVTTTALEQKFRFELNTFERWILLQILDASWKDHLHQMDQVKDAIGFRSFSQKDPRIEFKREAARLYDEMLSVVEDKTTDVIMRGKMSYQTQTPGPEQPANSQQSAPDAQQQAQKPADAVANVEAGIQTQVNAPKVARPATQVQSRTLRKAPASTKGPAVQAIGRNELVTMINPENGGREEMKYKKAKPLMDQGWRLAED